MKNIIVKKLVLAAAVFVIPFSMQVNAADSAAEAAVTSEVISEAESAAEAALPGPPPVPGGYAPRPARGRSRRQCQKLAVWRFNC